MVIGILAAVAIGIFAFARMVASETQDKQVLDERDYSRNVAARLQTPSQEAIAGKDNSALAIKSDSGSAGSAAIMAAPKNGTEVFQQVCSTRHGAGHRRRSSDFGRQVRRWGPRIAEGKATLYEHALKGFQGKTGVMPAKGGRTDLADDLVKQAVDHMVQMAQ